MKWHGFGMYGMGGPATDPAESGFSKRVAQLGIDIHGSPYLDTEAENIVLTIDKIPESEGVFVWGTSLGSNNTAVVCFRAKRRIDGAFGFQASQGGAKGFPINSNVRFAHLISSNTIIPLPGLGSYVWPTGTINPSSYHRDQHDIPHPGDYDKHDQDMFLAEMKRIMEHTHGNPSTVHGG
jgi:hypothetical protein